MQSLPDCSSVPEVQPIDLVFSLQEIFSWADCFRLGSDPNLFKVIPALNSVQFSSSPATHHGGTQLTDCVLFKPSTIRSVKVLAVSIDED